MGVLKLIKKEQKNLKRKIIKVQKTQEIKKN